MKRSLPLLTSLAKRLHPHMRGSFAETFALAVYLLHGYRPLPKSRQRSLVQTDLTLIRGLTIILVEVKYRTSRSRGHVAVGQGQQQRLHRQMRAVSGRYSGHTLRLEIFLVFPHWPFFQRLRQPYTR